MPDADVSMCMTNGAGNRRGAGTDRGMDMTKQHTNRRLDRRSNRRPIRAAALAAVAIVAVAAGCTPAPGTNLIDGGEYVVEMSVPPQHISNEFELFFGLATCTASVTTPEVHIPRTTVTLPPFVHDGDAGTATIPAVSVQLPRSRVSAGAFSLTCNDELIGSVGVAIEFDAVASVRSATLDLDTGMVTLDEPTISVTGAEATFAGAPVDAPPVPLDPITVAVPEFEIRL